MIFRRAMSELILMENIHKSFGHIQALNGVTLEIFRGEILGLLGENGAGKTTLMNILYGIFPPDRGRILIEGREVTNWSPLAAKQFGIAMVHQHFTLIPRLTVLENVLLGTYEKLPFLMNRKEKHILEDLILRYNFQLDPEEKVENLTVGQCQQIEILKALYQNARVLILDEPTSVLAPKEVENLFCFLRSYVNKGNSVIFVTHKLKEVKACADRVAILRGGKLVAKLSKQEIEPEKITCLIVGREEQPSIQKTNVAIAKDSKKRLKSSPVLSVRDVQIVDEAGRIRVDSVSFEVYPGEIFGIAGVANNGQRELVEGLLGIRQLSSGTIMVAGQDITCWDIKQRLMLGVRFIPDDRIGVGVVGDLSVAYNVLLDQIDEYPFSKASFLRHGEIYRTAEVLSRTFQIKAPSLTAPVKYLSGGNIQKVIIARAFKKKPRVLIACEPTHGLDIAATAYVREKLREVAQDGAGVIVVSTDLDEIEELCDRVAVMFKGRILGIISKEEWSREKIGKLMLGED